MRQYLLKPGVLIGVGLLVLALVAGELWHLNAKKRSASVSAHVSEQFGEALGRAGIETQSGPSR